MDHCKRIGISIDDKLLKAVDSALPKSYAISRSEFIREAICYYLAKINEDDIDKVLSSAIEETIKKSIAEPEKHIARVLFKLAVELDMLMHVIAATNEIDQTTLKQLRDMCIYEVKCSIGSINFEDAVEHKKVKKVLPITLGRLKGSNL